MALINPKALEIGDQWLRDNEQKLIATAQEIWGFAELGLEEVWSSQLLADALQRESFEVSRGVSGMPTAFIGTFGSGKPRIALVAEYDALPGLSNEPVPERRPIPGKEAGHGCGHNLFGTAAVGAAIAARHAIEQAGLEGSVIVLGCPAEEVCIGKPYMARDGHFRDLDAALHFHPWHGNGAQYGTCCAYNSVVFKFSKGVPAHGNAPWYGKSALDAAQLMGLAVEFLREHMAPGLPPKAANTVNYTFTKCGKYPNVVPEEAQSWYVYRIITRQDLNVIHERIVNCAKGAALAMGVEVEYEVLTGTHEMIQNRAVAQVLHECLIQAGAPLFDEAENEFARRIQLCMGESPVGLDSSIQPPAGEPSGVTDVSEISWFTPTATLRTTCAPVMAGWHNWAVAAAAGMSIGHKGMMTAASVLLRAVLRLLADKKALADAWQEFAQKMSGREYKSPLLTGQKPKAAY